MANPTMSAEQQIRAKALECAVAFFANAHHVSERDLWKAVEKFERYIREGK